MADEWSAGGPPVQKSEAASPSRPPDGGSLSAARRRARRWRLATGVILLLGLVGAGAVYWLGTRGPDLSTDPAMLGFNRAEERQLGILYGKQGQLIEDLTDALKQPGTQAILILLAAAVMAAACFYFARFMEDEASNQNETSSGNGGG